MNIIVRCCGERTEKKCIELAGKQGTVHIIKTRPFGECLRKSYELGISFKNQDWVPMIDGDVILFDDTIQQAIKYLNRLSKHEVFCLDGKTKDKIFMTVRRAGIHIYNRDLLAKGFLYIKDHEIKPESKVRHQMESKGFKTVLCPVIFGYHDYEQYYRDLWRKAFAQSRKLARLINRTNMIKKWKDKSHSDNDFKVILFAHRAAAAYEGKIIIDKNCEYDAIENIQKLGLTEKEEL